MICILKGLIGHGGYGEIYYAIDVRSQEEVAIKVEPKKRKGRTVKRMILEQKVFNHIQPDKAEDDTSGSPSAAREATYT